MLVEAGAGVSTLVVGAGLGVAGTVVDGEDLGTVVVGDGTVVVVVGETVVVVAFGTVVVVGGVGRVSVPRDDLPRGGTCLRFGLEGAVVVVGGGTYLVGGV